MRTREVKTNRVVTEIITNAAGGTPTIAGLSATETEVLNGVTAGTVTASKAVVVDANKDIGDFRNLDVTNLDAGASGTAGTVDIFPTTAAKGKFILSCTDQDGATNVTLKPAAMGQASVVSIPDPGAATANVLLTDAANDGAVVTATAAEINAVVDGCTATAAEINQAADISVQNAKLTPATAITGAAAAVKQSTVQTGDIIKTTLFIDLAGLKSVATLGDIIGDTGVSYIGQITAANNGTIFKGVVNCSEVPTTGDDDIDLYSATENTGAYDGAVGDLTETALMTAGGAVAIGTAYPLTALPAANEYLYLTAGAGDTAGTYDAGQIVIELWGYV